MRYGQKRISIPSAITLFITGLVLCMMFIQFRLSGNIGIHQFYDVGNKYTVSYEWYTQSYEGLTYNQDGFYHLTKEEGIIPIVLSKDTDEAWRYLYLEVGDLSTESLKAQILMENQVGEQVSVTEVNLTKGMNEIPLTDTISCKATILIKGETGDQFWLNGIQFRERPSYFSYGKVILFLLLGMLIFGGIVWLFYHFIGQYISWYMGMLVLARISKIYGYVYRLLKKLVGRLPNQVRIWGRRILFILMIALMLFTENFGSYNKWEYYKYYLLCNGILLGLIALLSISDEDQDHRVNWMNPLMLAFMVYAALTIISDLVVPKTQMYTGLFLLLFFAFLYYVLGKMKEPMQLLADFAYGVKACYWVTGVFCLFCRPISAMAEGRYVGPTISPYSYALFLGVVIPLFLVDLDQLWQKKAETISWISTLVGLASSLYFMWATQSRNGLLAVFACLLYFTYRIHSMRREGVYAKRAIVTLFVFIIVAVPTVYGVDWSISHLPKALNTQVTFPNDFRVVGQDNDIEEVLAAQDEGKLMDRVPLMQVMAAESTDSEGVFRSTLSLDLLSSGRITIYKEYIANMNLFGHPGDLVISGAKMRAHNGVLQTGYRFGVLAMIPYTVMLILAVGMAFFYAWKNKQYMNRYPILPIILLLSIVVMMMLDNVERNFRYLPWVAYYLLIGFLGNEERD